MKGRTMNFFIEREALPEVLRVIDEDVLPRYRAFPHFVGTQTGDGVQEHDAVVGQCLVGRVEEVLVAVEAEVFEGADADDPIDWLGELLPAL